MRGDQTQHVPGRDVPEVGEHARRGHRRDRDQHQVGLEGERAVPQHRQELARPVHPDCEVQELAALGCALPRAALLQQAVERVFDLDAHGQREGAADHRHPERAGGFSSAYSRSRMPRELVRKCTPLKKRSRSGLYS